MLKKFKAKLTGEGPGKAWTVLRVPFDVQKTFGTRARVSVRGTMNQFKFRASLFPDSKGTHVLMVNKAMRAGAKAEQGDVVNMDLEPDTKPRTVTVPPDLKKALAKAAAAKATFDKLAPSHKKAYVEWINQAKRDETRATRVEKTVAMLKAGKKLDR